MIALPPSIASAHAAVLPTPDGGGCGLPARRDAGATGTAGTVVNRTRPALATMRSRLRLVRHHVMTPRWQGAPLTIALLSDFHVARPWTTPEDLQLATRQVMAEAPDLVVLGGDFLAQRRFRGRLAARAIFDALAGLSAPLGVFAVLGNHDWRDCPAAVASGYQRNSVIEAAEAAGVPLLRNASLPMRWQGHDFWLVGLDSQRAYPQGSGLRLDDAGAAYAEVPPGAPVILLAHEPDCFADPDPRLVLQLSGHTHAGQMNLFGWRPLTPSRHGSRYAWGHVAEAGRHLVVSGGIGFSGLPLRLGAPPEWTMVTLGGVG